MSVNGRNGKLVASFPVEDSDQIMLVTDKGQLIRCPVERHPHRRPLDAGRHRVRHRRGRARGLGRAGQPILFISA
jgi:DNA gyrase/topoisomerase IV subunit A